MLLEQYLQNIGLSDKEAKIYLTGLQLGPASIQSLAQSSGVKRSTIYEIIKSLQDKNLVNITPHNKRKLFTMQEPDNLVYFLKQRENILQQILPDLEALKNSASSKPSIRYFEGIDGLKKIYQDMIKKPGEILAITAPKSKIADKVFDYLAHDWVKARVAAQIMIKRIDSAESVLGRLVGQKTINKNKLEELYFWPAKNYPFSIGIYVYRQKVAFISYQEQEMVGIIIRSGEINKSMKAAFDLFWQKNFTAENNIELTASELAGVMEGIIERDKKDELINQRNFEDLEALGLKKIEPITKLSVDTGKIMGVSNVANEIIKQTKRSSKIIAIEGLSGTGKSSTAQILAKDFSGVRFSLGLIFRYLAFLNKNQGENDYLKALSRLSYRWLDGDLQLFDEDQNVLALGDKLRSDALEKMVPVIASLCQKEVIEFAGAQIKKLAQESDKKIIIEGRKFTLDFLPCDVRVELTARLAVRSYRRWQEGYW